MRREARTRSCCRVRWCRTEADTIDQRLVGYHHGVQCSGTFCAFPFQRCLMGCCGASLQAEPTCTPAGRYWPMKRKANFARKSVELQRKRWEQNSICSQYRRSVSNIASPLIAEPLPLAWRRDGSETSNPGQNVEINEGQRTEPSQQVRRNTYRKPPHCLLGSSFVC